MVRAVASQGRPDRAVAAADAVEAGAAVGELLASYHAAYRAGAPFALIAAAAVGDMTEHLSQTMPPAHARFFARAPLVFMDSVLREDVGWPLSSEAAEYGLTTERMQGWYRKRGLIEARTTPE